MSIDKKSLDQVLVPIVDENENEINDIGEVILDGKMLRTVNLTFLELDSIIKRHNKAFNIKMQYEDKNPLDCVIVFKNSSWGENANYPLESRSYRFRSDEKYFIGGMLGNSIYADTLDKSDIGVRLDWYIWEWEIDYCYIIIDEVDEDE